MSRDLNVMRAILAEKDKEIAERGALPLNAEGARLATGNRITLDMITTPADPRR